LITCRAGAVNSRTASLSEAILQNKLARAVFASSEDVDARIVPRLLEEMMSSGAGVRDALKKSGFTQIVFGMRFLRVQG
jgi:hypothetical protein